MEKVKAIGAAAAEAAWTDSAPLRSPSSPAPLTAPADPEVPPSVGWAGPVRVDVTAPAAPSSEPTASLTDLLDGLVGSVDGVNGAILASVDGFGLARSSSMANEAAHPAMLAAAVGLAHQLVDMGRGTTLRQLLVDHDGGLLLVWPIGAERVLAVLAANQVDQRSTRAFVQEHAADLAEVSA